MPWAHKRSCGRFLFLTGLVLYYSLSGGAAEAPKSCPALRALLEELDKPVVTMDPGMPPANAGSASGVIEAGRAKMSLAAESSARKTAEMAGAVFRVDGGPKWKLWVGRQALKLREFLRKVQHHDIPIVAVDDATPVHAHALASDAFQTLTEEQKALVNLEAIRKDLFDTLASVENYKTDIDQFVNESATKMAQVEALEDWVQNNPTARNFTLELPAMKIQDGALVEGTERTMFTDATSVKIRINRLKGELKERFGNKILAPNESEKKAIAHAISIKRLETFRNELIRQQLAHQGTSALPDDLKDALRRIDALYDSAHPGKVKDEFRPPAWADAQLKVVQAHAELKTMFLKAIPSKLEKAEQSKIVQYVKSLSPEDRRALGIEKFAEAVMILKRATWLTKLTSGGTATGSAGGLIYSLFLSDRSKKEKCAAAETEDEFVLCVRTYLTEKFGGRFALNSLDLLELINSEGKLSSSTMRAEIADIKVRRAKFMKRLNRDAEMEDATRLTAQEEGGTPISEERMWLDLAEMKSDPDFKSKLFAERTYFTQKFPTYSRILKPLMEQAVGVPFGSEKYVDIIVAMRKTSRNLAKEFNELMYSRELYKNPNSMVVDPFSNDPFGDTGYNGYGGSRSRLRRNGNNGYYGGSRGNGGPLSDGGWGEVPSWNDGSNGESGGTPAQNGDGTIPVPQQARTYNFIPVKPEPVRPAKHQK